MKPLIKRPLKICHVGDVHIFNHKRHEEHREVLDKLCSYIKTENIDLLYLGGDIIDSKNKLSPEQVQEAVRFLQQVSDIVPVVMIPGNHDLLLLKKGSLDALSPIVDSVHSTFPIYYLKYSGIYNLYDIDWIVWSCIDDKNPLEVGVRTSDYSIACYHGIVSGASVESGYSNFRRSQSLELFKDFDNLFLCDVHKRQFFLRDEIPYGGYSGSLLQIDQSEDQLKGGLVWTWDETDGRYYPSEFNITNQYGFKTWEIEDLSSFDIDSVELLTDKFIGRVVYTGKEADFSTEAFNEIKKKIQTKLPENTITTQKRFKKIFENKQTKTKGKGNIDFFKEYFKELPPHEYEELKNLDIQIDKEVGGVLEYVVGEYNIEEITIHNFLSFGFNNTIRFNELGGVVGILAENTVGKTSIFLSLMFAAFGGTLKGKEIGKLINDQNPNTPAFVEIVITINGVRWRIKREITIPKKQSYKIKLEVFETINGEEVPRHKETWKQTDIFLNSLIGDEEMFLRTVLYDGQGNKNEFVKCRNAERLDLIIKFLGINRYDLKFSNIDEKFKGTETELKVLRTTISSLPLPSTMEEEISALTQDKQVKTDRLGVIKTQIDEESKKRDKIKASIYSSNIQTFKKSDTELLVRNSMLEIELKKQSLLLSETTKQSKELLVEWNQDKKLKGQVDTWEEDRTTVPIEEGKVRVLGKKITDIKNQLKSEFCFTCGKPWHEVHTEAIENDLELIELLGPGVNIKVLINSDKTLKKLLEAIEEKILLYKNNINLFNTNQLIIKKLNKNIKDIDIKIKNINIEILKINNEIEENKETIILIVESKTKTKERDEKIKIEKELSSEIDRKRKELSEIEISLKFIERDLVIKHKNIELYNIQYSKIIEVELKNKNYKLYKDAMHRSGIPSIILKTFIPFINEEINEYISDIFNFNIQFVLEEDTLEIVFVYDDLKIRAERDVLQASGMEGTVINLAIRAVLHKISLLPKPSLIMLDEIFTTLDKNNIPKIKELLNKLTKQYKNVLVISHLDEVRSFPTSFVELEKYEGVTSIV